MTAIAGMLKSMGLTGSTALIATADVSAAVHRSARNIQGVSVLPVCDLNALEILKPQKVLFTREALDQLKAGEVPTKAQPEKETTDKEAKE